MKVKVTCKFRQAHSHVKGFWSAGRHFLVGETLEIDASEREVEQLKADAPHILDLEFPTPSPLAPPPEPVKAKK